MPHPSPSTSRTTILALLAITLVTSGCSSVEDVTVDEPTAPTAPTAPTTPLSPTTLCPSDAPEALALCLSFALVHGSSGGTTDVGGLEVHIEGHPEGVPGRVGDALSFNGQGDRIFIEGFALASPSLTVSAWVLPEGEQSKWASVVDFWGSGQGFWLGGSETPGGWAFWTDLSKTSHPSAVVAGMWQHIAAVREVVGSGEEATRTLSLYVNGELMSHRTDVGPTTPPPLRGVYLGGRGDRSDYFHGALDEVMIWTSARTPEQICTDAGGVWHAGRCEHFEPVAAIAGPCHGVDCSGHGRCVVERSSAFCECDDDYLATGELSCGATNDPCGDIANKAKEWSQWYRGQVDAELLEAADAFAADYTPQNSAWKPSAETQTALGLSGLMKSAEEIACLGFLQAAEQAPHNPVALTNASTCMFLLGWSDDARAFADCSLSIAPKNASAKAAQAYH
ncbi:MAG: LamG domain-containing protein, partial [Deltaproteobacteria bacterium]|nr:LamG domain-containing protein [Deltaproteobacteria bacterium]